MNHYIISYDISDNHLRQKVAYDLEKYGAIRLQKSVFIAPNMRNEDIQRIKTALKDRIQQHPRQLNSDSLICFPIQKKDIQEMVWAGDSEKLREILRELLFMLF